MNSIQPKISSRDLAVAARFMSSLPRFLRRRIQGEESQKIIESRLARREEDFLRMAKKCIFGYEKSPYFLLLKNAGCEYMDFRKIVLADGLESALSQLLSSGVYLTIDEYKGRKPVRRGSFEMSMHPGLAHNVFSAYHVPVKSSGSRSPGTPVMIDLDFIADCAVNSCYQFTLRGGEDWLKADWEIPGGGALFRLLKFSRFGIPPVRWFSHVDPKAPGLHPRYAWSAHWFRFGGFLAGGPLPRSEHVPFDCPRTIITWMREVLNGGKTPLLFTFVSSAVRISQEALDMGVDLEGAKFLAAGEPITEARRKSIVRSGAEMIPRYGCIEAGPIAYGCLEPRFPDDLHVNLDLAALIQAGKRGGSLGIPDDALMISSLRMSAPFIFFNISMGDKARLENKECGCPLGKMGYFQKISFIRSFEKLTGGGMSFDKIDIIRILEEDLPSRFGGIPTDYQIVEEEDEEGIPVLRLFVHPRLGSLNEISIKDFFINCLKNEGGVSTVMGTAWEKARFVQIERKVPRAAASGKILHVVSSRKSQEKSE